MNVNPLILWAYHYNRLATNVTGSDLGRARLNAPNNRSPENRSTKEVEKLNCNSWPISNAKQLVPIPLVEIEASDCSLSWLHARALRSVMPAPFVVSGGKPEGLASLTSLVDRYLVSLTRKIQHTTCLGCSFTAGDIWPAPPRFTIAT